MWPFTKKEPVKRESASPGLAELTTALRIAVKSGLKLPDKGYGNWQYKGKPAYVEVISEDRDKSGIPLIGDYSVMISGAKLPQRIKINFKASEVQA